MPCRQGASARGFILPPRIALIAMIAMVLLHITMPLAVIVPAPFSHGGAAVMAAGVAMQS